MIKERIDGLGEFEIHAGYLIGRIDYGKHAGPHFVDALSELIQKHYQGRPLIYISDRVNSYSLDPAATMDLIRRNNIRFVGIVTYTDLQKTMYVFEEQVIKGITMCDFVSLNDALAWAKQKLPEIESTDKS
jgi:hypothetical protein